MKLFKYLVIVGIIAGTGAYFYLKTPTVLTAKAQDGNVIETVYATGTVETTSMVPIRSKITGRLIEIFQQEGQDVKKDAVLAKLDDADIQTQIKELKALVDFYQIEMDRAEKLLKQGAGSVQSYDKAKSTFLNSEAMLNRKLVDLKEHIITSPADCKVIRQDGEVGELITTSYDLFWLDCSGKYRITAEVDEEDINHVKIGQKVLLKYEGDFDNSYEGKVASITPMGDEVSRVFRVRIEIGQDLPFMLGMSTEANIITGKTNNTVLVPSSAVVDSVVWVVNNDILEKRTVSVGAIDDKKTEIKNGLSSDEIIVTQPQKWFKDGKKVQVIVDKTGRKRR